MSVEEWNKKFGTLNGEIVAEVLALFRKRTFLIKEPHIDMRSNLRRGFSDIGVTFRGFEIVSLGRVRKGTARLLEVNDLRMLKRFEHDLLRSQKSGVASFLVQEFRGRFKECIGERYPLLVEAVEESIGYSLEARLLIEIERYVPEELREDLREAIRGILWDGAWSNLRICLYYQIGFLLSGKLDEANAIAPFTRSFAMGNLPMGFVEDNLLVVVK